MKSYEDSRTEKLIESLNIQGGLRKNIETCYVGIESEEEIIDVNFGEDGQEAFNSGVAFALDLIKNGWVDPESLR